MNLRSTLAQTRQDKARRVQLSSLNCIWNDGLVRWPRDRRNKIAMTWSILIPNDRVTINVHDHPIYRPIMLAWLFGARSLGMFDAQHTHSQHQKTAITFDLRSRISTLYWIHDQRREWTCPSADWTLERRESCVPRNQSLHRLCRIWRGDRELIQHVKTDKLSVC